MEDIADKDLDADIIGMRVSEMADEIRKLRAAIRRHRDSSGHDLCWFTPELWDVLPEKITPSPRVPSRQEFLRRCEAYRDSLPGQNPVSEDLSGREQYLKIIENSPFSPVGWLYASVYDDLVGCGLAKREGGTYVITEAGREFLRKIRDQSEDGAPEGAR